MNLVKLNRLSDALDLFLVSYFNLSLIYFSNFPPILFDLLPFPNYFICLRHQLYGHLPPITKTIQVRRTRYAGHCWKSRDELISDVHLWTPSHGRAKAGRPARTYVQQLCADKGCSIENLPETMDNREVWRERIRNIRANSATWWWWWHLFEILKECKKKIIHCLMIVKLTVSINMFGF